MHDIKTNAGNYNAEQYTFQNGPYDGRREKYQVYVQGYKTYYQDDGLGV
ncbi:MAG TPA: hypothetical protein VEB42_12080 [Chitinophagaceae bacterium]|nr:hypothetical protein [Chitinophagaceae bacterium]